MRSLNSLVGSDLASRSPAWGQPEFAPLIDAIGQPSFPERLMVILEELVGIDQCILYRLHDREIETIVSLSRAGAHPIPDSGLTAYELSRHLSQAGADDVRIAVERIPDIGSATGVRPLRRAQRIVVCGRRNNSGFAIYLLRAVGSEAAQSETISANLRNAFGTLLAIVAKHADAHALRPNLARAFNSLPEMQQFIFDASKMSLRESEVCARILLGLSPGDIATELGIGKESVITYRKRAFQRLEINSQRELLIWYLERWNARTGCESKVAWPPAQREPAQRMAQSHHH